ncbi:hypothetical protein GH714_010589 [Hevea brasiliensis]|uniref:Uncharacterized protein n=1 Tax=Hevea brasiliensis TaxID=3981 RepID=A0A6A6LGQ6_HEVBR|nr:hypothetical protein GH714_010589 [Hevea brasiliensis]
MVAIRITYSFISKFSGRASDSFWKVYKLEHWFRVGIAEIIFVMGCECDACACSMYMLRHEAIFLDDMDELEVTGFYE